MTRNGMGSLPSGDAREGLTAFNDRRRPEWSWK